MPSRRTRPHARGVARPPAQPCLPPRLPRIAQAAQLVSNPAEALSFRAQDPCCRIIGVRGARISRLISLGHASLECRRPSKVMTNDRFVIQSSQCATNIRNPPKCRCAWGACAPSAMQCPRAQRSGAAESCTTRPLKILGHSLAVTNPATSGRLEAATTSHSRRNLSERERDGALRRDAPQASPSGVAYEPRRGSDCSPRLTIPNELRPPCSPRDQSRFREEGGVASLCRCKFAGGSGSRG
jgi:hypothetical protein